jgi:predicted negative regulator of RcsB-dependent stress response
MLASLIFVWLLNRVWPANRRRDHNDIIGWQVGVLGTTYAVILGFMLYAVWTSYQEADINAETEANCLVSVFRVADGLPAAQRDKVHELARGYVKTVIEQEWPAMEKAELGLAGHQTIEKLWTAVLETKPATYAEQTSMNLALTEIDSMTEHRRVRQLQSQSKLPGILWVVLIAGGIITTLSACMFGIDNFRLHCLQVVSLTLLLSLILVAIADIDRPFQGAVHVQPRGFERARDTLAQLP